MKKFKTVPLPSSNVKRTSSNSLMRSSIRSLGKRQTNGNETKRLAEGLVAKALHVRSKPVTIGLTESYQLGFETVKDNFISFGYCPICGLSKCKMKRLARQLPSVTISRMLDEGFDCEQMHKCYMANRKEYLQSEKVKLQLAVLEKQIDGMDSIGLQNAKIELRNNLDLLDGKAYQRIKERLAVCDRYKGKNGRTKAIKRTVYLDKFEPTKEQKSLYRRNIRELRAYIAETEAKIEQIKVYRCPELLSIADEKRLTEMANRETNAKKRRSIQYRINATRYFLINE